MLHNESNPRDMIKEILQKIIDEMGTLESDRIMPEHRRPKAMKIEVESATPVVSKEIEDEELDPSVLSELMNQAGNADETGALPEDTENDLPPEISEAVRRKRKIV